MLHRSHALKGYEIASLNFPFAQGESGTVSDFYFDDLNWTVRYVAAQTGKWFNRSRVLFAINSKMESRLTNECEHGFETESLSQQYEKVFGRVHCQSSWQSARGANRATVLRTDVAMESNERDYDLRNTRELIGCHVQTKDGMIGRIEDLIVDDATWTIRYLVMDARNGWHGKHVLIPTHWIEGIDLGESKVFVNLRRETIQQAPNFNRELAITPDYEFALKGYYSASVNSECAEPALR